MGPPFGNPGCVLASRPPPLIGPRSPPVTAGGRSLIFAVKLLAVAVAERFARTGGSRPRLAAKTFARPMARERTPGRTVSTAVFAAIGEER
jgi:hypothetical protein